MLYPVSKPSITEKEIAYVNDAVTSGWVSSNGPYIEKFEQAFAARHGFKYGITLNSGTNALFVALKALGISRPFEEVIVPDFTMIATALAPYHLGATSVYVDCGDDLLIDIQKLEDSITPQTRVIIPVHIYGRRCDMKAIMALANKHHITVLTDAAEAHGVEPGGDGAIFSFFGNKIMTTGEGGMFVTNDKNWAEEVNYLKNMAFEKEHTFLHQKAGYNMRMTNMQAALGLAQLERLDELLSRRQVVEQWYNKYLPEEMLMPPRDVVWMYDIKVPPAHRDILRRYLAKQGIDTRLFFKPMSVQPCLKGKWMSEPDTNALKWSKQGMYLPTYPDLTEEDVKTICRVIKEYQTLCM